MSKMTKENDDHHNERVKESLLTASLQNEPHDRPSTSTSFVLTNVSVHMTQRPVYNQKKYQQEFARTSDDKENTGISKRIKSFLSLLHPRHLLSVFTIVNFIVDYDFKKNFFADVFSGITGNFLFYIFFSYLSSATGSFKNG